ncbi:MAG: hypothetical protein U0R24_00810 [Solirubrobacterales bacterium]
MTPRLRLPDRLLAIDRALAAAGFEHAFGGAIALAYWTLDPRGTSDIDVNVFIPAERCEEALAALPDGVAWSEDDVAAIHRDGQVRLWWEEIPVDLFFDYVELHADAARNRRTVPFEGVEIPILGPVELATFKAMFDRTRDWADIEAMLEAETLDVDAVRANLLTLVGEGDRRVQRLDETATRI